MTTAEIPVAELRKQAATIRPGRVAATAILWVLVAFGWVLGAAWRTAVFLALLAWHRGLVLGALSVRYGVLRGYGMTDEQIEARAKTGGPGKPSRE